MRYQNKTSLIILATVLFGCGSKVDFKDMPAAAKADCGDNPCAITTQPEPTPAVGEAKTSYFFVRRAADILFVVDSSGSMSEEQTLLANGFPSFITSLNQFGGGTLDWRIGVTTTDTDNSGPGKQGKLLQIANLAPGTFFLDNTVPEAQGNPAFQATIAAIGDQGSGNEKGIAAARMVAQIEIPKPNGFMRPDTPFSVIVLSDEDENSNGSYAANSLSDPNVFVSGIRSLDTGASLQRQIKFHPIVAGTQACVNGIGESMGNVYKALQTLTGGVLGDICAGDYQTQLNFLAQSIVNDSNTYSLPCNNVESGTAKAYVQEAAGLLLEVPSTFVAPNKLLLTNPPPYGSIVKAKFVCLN